MRLNTLTLSLVTLLALQVPTLAATGTGITTCNIIGNNGKPVCSDADTPTNVDSVQTNLAAGNPINVLNGNKFEYATDIQAVGDYGLSFNRYYNSRSAQRGMLGIGWRHDYEMQLQDLDDQIDIIQADGRQLHFQKTAAAMGSSTLFVTRYVSDKPELGYIERTQSADPTKAAWLWTIPTGKQFQFIAHRQTTAINQLGQHRFGQLSRVTEQANDPSSPYWSLTYGTDGTLAQVRNHIGDTLKFAYDTTTRGLPKISVTSNTLNKNSNNTADGNNSSDNTGRWVYLLDQNNNLAQVVSPTGVRTGYQYNDPFDKHNLTSKYSYDKTKPQLITEWTYDAYDRAISSTHKGGIEKVSVVFDKDTVLPTQAGHIFTNRLTNSVGETTDYRYQYKNGEAQLLSVIGAGCVTCGPSNVSYEYDNTGRVIQTNKLDDSGQVIASTSTSYDTLGRTTKVTQTNEDNQQIWLAYSYDNADYPMLPTSITRPSVVEGKSSQTSLTYDEAGNVTAMTESGFRPATVTNQVQSISRTTTYQYEKINGKQQLIAVDGPLQGNQDTTRNQYDNQGQLTQIAFPEGITEQFTYQTIAGQSLLTAHTDGDGVVTKMEYDSKGQAIAMQRGDQQLSLEYDSKDRPVKWQNQLDQTITASYDDSKQQVTYQLYDGQKIVNQYDTEGRLTQRKWLDQQGSIIIEPVTWQYNDQNYDTNKDNASNSIQPYQKPNSSIAKITAQSQNQESHSNVETTFNPTEALLSATTEATVGVDIDPLGNILQIVLPEGATYERLYDDFGRMVYAKDANTGISIVEYDLNDQPTFIHSETTTQTASYDAAGRLITAKYCKLGNQASAEQSCETIEYKYDGAHLSQITDPIQTTQYTYDAQSRLTIESVQFKDSDKQWQTEYQYDDTGRLQKVSLPEGAVLIYGYDDISNPITVKYQASTQGWIEGLIRRINPNHNSTALISNIQGDSARGLLGFTHSNGIVAQADYDKVGRMTTWQDGDYQKTLSYDRSNQITAISSKQSDKQRSENLNYNVYGELINVTDAKHKTNAQYQYDRNGNRLSHTSYIAKAEYKYEAGTDRLLSISQTASNTDTDDNEQQSTYSYDAAGNPTLISSQGRDNESQQRQLTYGARGQLIQLSDKNQTTDYRYNHAMQRVSKTTDANTQDKQEQRYLWQQGLLDAEIDVKDNIESVTRRYIYVGLRPIAIIDYDADNTPSIYTIHTDHLGTPQQVSNEKQDIVWQGEYDAFGNVTVKAVSKNKTQNMQAERKGWFPTLMNSANATQSITNEPFEFNLRFAGQYEDSESGYYYNWHRYYNPETGRYLTSDPIGLNGGLNTYGYAGANPVSFVDPWGLYTIFIGGAGDHERFWHVFPNHGAVKDYAQIDFNSILTGHFQTKLNVNKSRADRLAIFNIKYYGYNEIDAAYDAAIRGLKNFPTLKINVVGHSLGGWQAAHLAQRLNEFKCDTVANLITLDPVGEIYSWNPAGSIKFRSPNTTGSTWTNIRAESSSMYPGWNNIVANAGGQWNPSNSGLSPTYNYQIEADHLAIRKMMKHKIIVNGKQQNKSPYDLLMQYYNNQSNLNLINTFQ